jgi:MORN repeat
MKRQIQTIGEGEHEAFPLHALPEDVQKYIFDLLSYQLKLVQAVTLTVLVCHPGNWWTERMSQLPHLDISNEYFIYRDVIRLFTCVTSLTTDRCYLSSPQSRFLKVTELRVLSPFENPEDSDDDVWNVDISAWVSLRKLDITGSWCHCEGFEHLTSLTDLSFSDNSVSVGELSVLTQLKTLSLLCCNDEYTECVQNMTTLCWLATDQPSHMDKYTGSGKLTAFLQQQIEYNDDNRGGVKQIAAFNRIHTGCTMCAMNGRWQNGLFTGFMVMKYKEQTFLKTGYWNLNPLQFDESPTLTNKEYSGDFLEGKRDGIGTEYCGDVFTYSGAWKNDKPHGNGILYFHVPGLKPCKLFMTIYGVWKNGVMRKVTRMATHLYTT